MSGAPSNPTEVVLQLAELSRQLGDATQELNEADVAAVNAREAAKLAEAKAFLSAQGSVDARRSHALIDTADLRLQAGVADALVRGLQQTLKTLHTRIDVGRTYAATIRSEISLAGYGGGA